MTLGSGTSSEFSSGLPLCRLTVVSLATSLERACLSGVEASTRVFFGAILSGATSDILAFITSICSSRFRFLHRMIFFTARCLASSDPSPFFDASSH